MVIKTIKTYLTSTGRMLLDWMKKAVTRLFELSFTSKLSSTSESKLPEPPKHYKGIEDLPIFNFFKIREKRDLRYLIKCDPFEIDSREHHPILEEVYDQVLTEYYDEFGVTTEHKEDLRTRMKIAVLESKLARTNDRRHKTMIEILKTKIQKNISVSLETQIDQIEKARNGQPLDPHRVSVKQFFTYIKNLK